MTNNLKTLILVLLLGGALGYFVSTLNILPGSTKSIGIEKAKEKTEAYLGSLPLDSYEVVNVTEDKDIYKIELSVNEMPYTSYMSKDGRLLFQGGIDLEKEMGADGQPGTVEAAELPKSDKPNVELFVMSHCPYGTQMEKGILPVVNALGDKIDFEVKFVDYAMHEKLEIDEQLNQYCIQKDMGKETYLSYLGCFLEDGDTQRCINQTGVNQWELNTCIAATDAEFSITDNYNNKDSWLGQFPPFNTHKDDNTKYGVAGSPTLIVNAVEAQGARDSSSLLATICGAFNEQPEECLIVLDSTSPAPGFGTGVATTDTDAAQCN